MSAVANFSLPSFFTDIPQKAIPAAQCAWDGISTTRGIVVDGFYIAFCQKLEVANIAPPPRHEFVDWFRGIRAGEVDRPREADTFPIFEVRRSAEQFETRATEVASKLGAGERLRRAHAIIVQAVRLQQTMIDAGYSPESCEMEDQIVAEAIKDWLTAEAGDWGETMNLPTTPAEIAIGYLKPGDSEQSAKLLDVFAIYLQRELSLAIANARAAGGAA